MDTHTTETHSGIPRSRSSLLLDVRPYQCSYIGSQNDPRPDPFRGRTFNGSGLVLNEGGRIEGMPPTDRASGARGELSGSDEPDPFADWRNAKPVKYPKGITEPCCKAAYLIGRSDFMIESHKAQDEMIKKVIELANKGILTNQKGEI